jgi:hypothetical protein
MVPDERSLVLSPLVYGRSIRVDTAGPRRVTWNPQPRVLDGPEPLRKPRLFMETPTREQLDDIAKVTASLAQRELDSVD